MTKREKLDHACGVAPNDMPTQIAVAAENAGLDLLAQRCIDLEAVLKECVEAMIYAINHEHEAIWHDADDHHSAACKFCARIDPVIFKAKEMLGVK